jgi:hypothetical protein
MALAGDARRAAGCLEVDVADQQLLANCAARASSLAGVVDTNE